MAASGKKVIHKPESARYIVLSTPYVKVSFIGNNTIFPAQIHAVNMFSVILCLQKINTSPAFLTKTRNTFMGLIPFL